MRSEFRCSEHFQGDYCNRVDGHEGDVHVGKHNTWVVEEGESRKISPAEVGKSTIVREMLEPGSTYEISFEKTIEILAGV